MSKPVTSVRIFAASPGDVKVERARVNEVVEDLRPLAEHVGVVLGVTDWSKVVPDLGRPEQIILDQLRPSEWDLFIGILWHRFGTPTGGVDSSSGDYYRSGTEEEFRVALQLWRQHARPRILIYRCRRPIPPEDLDPDQYRLVKGFFDDFAPNADHPGLYQTFDSVESFERLLRHNLTELLLQFSEAGGHVLSPQEVETLVPRTVNTLPRRPAFFGRKDEIAKALRALSPDDRGWGLVIDGIGGIGKTALAVELAYICQERDLFEGFIFVTAKEKELRPEGIRQATLSSSTLDGLLEEVAQALSHISRPPAEGHEKRLALLKALRGRKILLILDNLETLTRDEQDATSDFLRLLPQDCKAVVTSRRRLGEAVVTLRLSSLSWNEAYDLISDQISHHRTELSSLSAAGESGWKRLYDQAGGSPLALLWIIGIIRTRGLSFHNAISLLSDGGMSNDLNRFLYAAAKDKMDSSEISVLSTLSLFAVPASKEAMARVAGLQQQAVDTVIERLQILSLVDQVEWVIPGAGTEDRYGLHPLTRSFARNDLTADRDRARVLWFRFGEFCLDYARRYLSVSGIQEALDRLEGEWPNYENCIHWLWARAGITGETGGPLSTITGMRCADREAAQLLARLVGVLQVFLELNEQPDRLLELSDWAYQAAVATNELSIAQRLAETTVDAMRKIGRSADAEKWEEKLKAVLAPPPTKTLRIFFSYASSDKPVVRRLYRRLRDEGFDPWLDEENLLPGQNWKAEISRAVRSADIVLVCLSRASISKVGYVQGELKFGLDVADKAPEGAIYIVPLRLEQCEIPERLRQWQSADLFDDDGYERLIAALRNRANVLGRISD